MESAKSEIFSQLFAPTVKPSKFSRLQNADLIARTNADRSQMSSSIHITTYSRLLWQYRALLRQANEEEGGENLGDINL